MPASWCAPTLIVLTAALGLPPAALAQIVADDGKSTEVSGLTVEARAGQCPPGDPHGLAAKDKGFDAPPDAMAKRTQESSGTRAFVQALAIGSRNNDIDYTRMPPRMAKLMREQFPRAEPFIACQGVFKGIKFLHVSQAGDDDFEVDFSNGTLEWEVTPFHALQLTYRTYLRYFYPQPATRQFEDWLKSIEEGLPNYADLTPDTASRLQVRWPALQTSLKDWGQRKGFHLLRQDDETYVFLVTYEHRQVIWKTSPPNAEGKFTALTYDEKAG
jgi:hypothetical protein